MVKLMTKTVLIVEDSVFERTLLKKVFEEEGFEVVGVATNGEVAIDMAMEFVPDLITVDNLLPDVLGVELIRNIREEGLTSKIIMISGVNMDREIDKAKAAGADDYIVKPYERQDLLERIALLLPHE